MRELNEEERTALRALIANADYASALASLVAWSQTVDATHARLESWVQSRALDVAATPRPSADSLRDPLPADSEHWHCIDLFPALEDALLDGAQRRS